MRIFGREILSRAAPAETRQDEGGDPGDAGRNFDRAINAAVSTASRRGRAGNSDLERTAAVAFGVGLLTRAMMVAEPSPAHPALTPEYLASAMQDLLLLGNHVAFLGTAGGEVFIDRASYYYLEGRPSPRTWVYRGTLNGPTGIVNRVAGASEVIHLRVNARVDAPWRGISPLAFADLSGEIIASVENSLLNEFSAITGKLLLHPALPGLSDPADKSGREAFVAGLTGVRGRHVMVLESSGQQAWGRSTGAPGGSWGQTRLGPEPDPNAVSLRSQVSQDILSALGIPAGLFSPREGAVSRESYRQLLTATIAPYARLMEHEFSAKIGQPIRLSFHRLAAADVAARARAYQSLVAAKIPADEARVLAGLDI